MNVIGITGTAGAGKDTIAEMLCADPGYVRIALADPMKRVAQDVFGFSRIQLWGLSEERNRPDYRYPRTAEARAWLAEWKAGRTDRNLLEHFGDTAADHFLTPRRALQLLGTEWGRHCYPDVWVERTLRDAKAVLSGKVGYSPWEGLVAIPTTLSMRVTAPTGVVVPDVRYDNEAAALRGAGSRVWRVERGGAGLKGEAGAHSSEVGVSPEYVDARIPNDGTLERLREVVSGVLGISNFFRDHEADVAAALAASSKPEDAHGDPD